MELAKFPIQPNNKRPYPHLLDNMNRGGYYVATKDKIKLGDWAVAFPNCNWACATGKASGVWVLDIDIKHNAKGDKSFYELIKGKPSWPSTYTVKTPSGGLHYYFKYDSRIPNLINVGPYGGIDVKTDGGYVLIPPSGINSAMYTIVDKTEPADAPEWLIEYLISRKVKETHEVIPQQDKRKNELTSIELSTARRRADIIMNKYLALSNVGNRNNNCLQMCCQFRDNIIPIGVAEEYVSAFVVRLNASDFPLTEAMRCLRSAYKYTPREPSFSAKADELRTAKIKNDGLSDFEQYTIAEYLAKINPNMRYVPERGWLLYSQDTGCWEVDSEGAKVVKFIAEELLKLHCRYPKQKELNRKNSNINAIKQLLESICAYSINDFRPEPYLLNLKDNVIDLRTLKTYEHNRDFNFLYRCNANYNPNGDISFVYKLIHDSLENPDEQTPDGLTNLTYFLMCLGYCITGERCEECAFYIWGPPRAGKSLIINMLYDVLGEFAGHFNISAISTQGTNDVQNFQLASIVDKRVVVSAETDKGTRFDAAKIKSLTGGEPVTCAFKYKNMFTSRNFPKMIFSSNNEIDIDPNDTAIWTRWRVFCFPNSHADNPDTELKTKLWAARDSFLQLICQAAEFWYAWHAGGHRLGYTPQMLTYLNERRGELDIVGAYLTEYSITFGGTSNGMRITEFVSVKELYRKFLSFCEDNHIPPYKEATFSSILKSKGFCKKTVKGKRGYMIAYNPVGVPED